MAPIASASPARLDQDAQLPFVSTGAFQAGTLREVIDLALDGGFSRIELASGTRWEPELLAPIRETAGRSIRYLVHNYFPPHEQPFVLNLASADAAMIARSLDHCRTAVDLCVEVGAPFFSVHSGFAFHARPEDLGRDLTQAPRVTVERAHEIFVESLSELCTYASARGVVVAIENNVLTPFNLVNGANRMLLCTTAREMVSTYDDVGSSNLGFLIDVGHLKVTAATLGFDPHAFLDEVAPHVVAVHVSDNDGTADRNLPFDDDAWFVPRLVEFPRAAVVVEAYDLECEQIREACRIVDRARQRRVSV